MATRQSHRRKLWLASLFIANNICTANFNRLLSILVNLVTINGRVLVNFKFYEVAFHYLKISSKFITLV